MAGSLLVALFLGWTSIAKRIDNYAYDWMFSLVPPPTHASEAAIVAIDDATYQHMGGLREARTMLTKALEALSHAQPKAVAIDVLLADPPENPPLRAAMCGTKNLVLASDVVNRTWQEPLPTFAACATGIGHDTADETSLDGVTRAVSLEKRAAKIRHWSLALEAFRIARGARILESPDDLQIGSTLVPARLDTGENRPLRVLYGAAVPQISLEQLVRQPSTASQLNGRVVFIGVTSLTAADSRVRTPVGIMPGVQVHSQVYETLAGGHFLTDARDSTVLAVCMAIAALAGLVFAFTAGWWAYVLGALLLVTAHVSPLVAFARGTVLPYSALMLTVWLSVAAAATFQHFVVRRDLRQSEAEKKRYRQAFQWVTHEMRTPLTAIQGSSELMGRYNLSEEKRKQMAAMINSESKRLARMIQTFLDVERLSEGHMELKREPFAVADVVSICMERVAAIADRKQISVKVESMDGAMNGDRELMEYAVYNLLTNAVKYSPAGTEIVISARVDRDLLRIAVKDQGIGMDAKELKNIFKKFYRTKRAEESGETGTGIGLSIVEQIVQVHSGRIEVASEVGRGSCFTVLVPAYALPRRTVSV